MVIKECCWKIELLCSVLTTSISFLLIVSNHWPICNEPMTTEQRQPKTDSTTLCIFHKNRLKKSTSWDIWQQQNMQWNGYGTKECLSVVGTLGKVEGIEKTSKQWFKSIKKVVVQQFRFFLKG